MEEPMSALTDRQQARDRLNKVFQSILDKVVPLDESVPLPGKKFVDWEELADEVDRTLVPTFLEERAPQKLLSTCVATMAEAAVFGVLARLEAEKRGIRQAVEVIGIHDGGNWIDPLWEEHFGCHVRILDYYHAAEHLNDVAKAVHASDPQAVKRLADELVGLLWEGKTDLLLGRLRELSAQAGPPLENDLPSHPRKILANNVVYFEKHQGQMDYPAYRARGWPIGSGITESGVKVFGKRVKGTEQFWSVEGAEAILALRSKWLSEDEESQHYWLGVPPVKAAA
jgi:hypothetical protein